MWLYMQPEPEVCAGGGGGGRSSPFTPPCWGCLCFFLGPCSLLISRTRRRSWLNVCLQKRVQVHDGGTQNPAGPHSNVCCVYSSLIWKHLSGQFCLDDKFKMKMNCCWRAAAGAPSSTSLHQVCRTNTKRRTWCSQDKLPKTRREFELQTRLRFEMLFLLYNEKSGFTNWNDLTRNPVKLKTPENIFKFVKKKHLQQQFMKQPSSVRASNKTVFLFWNQQTAKFNISLFLYF